MDKETFMAAAQRAAGSHWETNLGIIMDVGFDTGLALSKKDFKKHVVDSDDAPAVEAKLRKRIAKYAVAKGGNIRSRVVNQSKTVPDPAILAAISARLPKLGLDKLKQMSDGHQLAMAAENIMGYLLEAYLAMHLEQDGFIHCAGEVLRAVDFVTVSGSLWQVKNSDNSENSSSSQVRDGTVIQHWCRRRSQAVTAKSGKQPFFWGDLPQAFGVPEADWQSEEKFQGFVRECITINPKLLPIAHSVQSQLGLGF